VEKAASRDSALGVHLLYRRAFYLAVSDLLEEYAKDVALLEDKLVKEGPFPLSYSISHLQKVIVLTFLNFFRPHS
jgi:hypothetical protein